MKHFWLIFTCIAVGMILTGAIVGAAFWWWLGCTGLSIC
jgi:hypothetical protein